MYDKQNVHRHIIRHTTSCFITVSGTNHETPLLRTPIPPYLQTEDGENTESFVEVHVK